MDKERLEPHDVKNDRRRDGQSRYLRDSMLNLEMVCASSGERIFVYNKNSDGSIIVSGINDDV